MTKKIQCPKCKSTLKYTSAEEEARRGGGGIYVYSDEVECPSCGHSMRRPAIESGCYDVKGIWGKLWEKQKDKKAVETKGASPQELDAMMKEVRELNKQNSHLNKIKPPRAEDDEY